MKAEIKNIFQTILFLFCLLPVWVDAADYTVSTGTSTVDGDTFCGGSACTSSDKIIISGGARGNLLFKDFDGSGRYITITNKDTNPNAKVIITTGSMDATYAGLELRDCKYVNLEGNNDADLTYGIKVICDGTPAMASAVWVRGKSDHIKISYIEMAFDGNKKTSGNGVFIQDSTLSSKMIYDTFEIHHNYIHGCRYAGMYLGHNNPDIRDNPYVANISVHDNILEDIGAYGMTLKGVHATSGVCSIYNNVIKRTGLVYTATVGEKRNGIKTHYYYGSTYANIYGNWIEATKGAGLVIGNGDHQVYNNILVNCGTENNTAYGHGIRLDENNTSNIYDNIIIQPARYGVYHAWGTGNINVDRNLIGNPGVGYVESDSVLVEGSGANANIKHTDVADFNFPVWSDDGDYNNDIFTIPQAPLKPTGLTITEP
ncbi:MAG: right-handed parallel beta-helix repeat-containing protein [Deltaproteobacteria bacterium]|nr:right-handed parallel beta-helix repeat-containing protein [Deltaproteobacteria bacterium]